MNTELLDKIETLAGSLRAKTFRAAAEFILENKCRNIFETGCYRGNLEDGQSTLIFALLAKELKWNFNSYDSCAGHCDAAKLLLNQNELPGFVWCADSVLALGSLLSDGVDFIYLDSYDYTESDPGPCQRHELAEIGAVLGKMATPSAILLDDCIPETKGKTLLGAQFLKERGWKLAAEGYQLLFTNP